jgi:hypothetical protein
MLPSINDSDNVILESAKYKLTRYSAGDGYMGSIRTPGNIDVLPFSWDLLNALLRCDGQLLWSVVPR